MSALASIADEYAGQEANSTAGTIMVQREVYRIDEDHGGSDLMSIDVFDREPDLVERLRIFAGPSNDGDRYVSRLTSRLVAPESGEYRFSIASDDSSVLRVSTTGSEDDLTPVASVSGHVGPGVWNARPGQISDPILLEAGQEILVEARHADGGGSDHVAVAWTLPDGSFTNTP